MLVTAADEGTVHIRLRPSTFGTWTVNRGASRAENGHWAMIMEGAASELGERSAFPWEMNAKEKKHITRPCEHKGTNQYRLLV